MAKTLNISQTWAAEIARKNKVFKERKYKYI